MYPKSTTAVVNNTLIMITVIQTRTSFSVMNASKTMTAKTACARKLNRGFNFFIKHKLVLLVVRNKLRNVSNSNPPDEIHPTDNNHIKYDQSNNPGY